FVVCRCCLHFFFFFFFFFSSRRRHTRSLRDWSSDVCSSDLLDRRPAGVARGERVTIIAATSGDTGGAAIEAFRGSSRVDAIVLRSEERRVGKECRARWAADHVKEKET